MPLAASLAAATRKAADASALAARERVRAGRPIDEATFYPPEKPKAQPKPPQPQPVPAPVPAHQSPPTRGQQAAQGARVLQPRSAAHGAAAAAK